MSFLIGIVVSWLLVFIDNTCIFIGTLMFTCLSIFLFFIFKILKIDVC